MSGGGQNELWTLERIGEVVRERFGKRLSLSDTWRLLQRLNWSSQKPVRRARERDEEAIADWKERRWPEIRDKAASDGRTIVFLDESGLTQKPATRKTMESQGSDTTD